jgi:predicted enzyme related to lactoylglutathione lyase
MSRVVHFEIQASQPQLLIDFYTSLFGWKFNKYDPVEYWLIDTGPEDQPGINGGLLRRNGPIPEEMQSVNCYVCTVDVASLDDSLTKAVSIGGRIAAPKMPVTGVGWLAYIKDPDGNLLGMMQMDKSAA